MANTHTHWKKLTNPDFLGAYEVMTRGSDLTLTIKSVANEMITGTDGKKEECIVAHFYEPEKPMILNRTNMKTIDKKLGYGPFIEDWIGKKIQIYSAQVKAFGELTDALRIRPTVPATPKQEKIICEECGNEVKPVGQYTAAQVAAVNRQRYNAVLCADCSKRRQNKKEGVTDDSDAE